MRSQRYVYHKLARWISVDESITFSFLFQDRIIFMTFLAAPVGLNVIAKAFPKVKIVTSMVDPVLSRDTLWILPGIGNFGGKLAFSFKNPVNSHMVNNYFILDRYFGTEDDDE